MGQNGRERKPSLPLPCPSCLTAPPAPLGRRPVGESTVGGGVMSPSACHCQGGEEAHTGPAPPLGPKADTGKGWRRGEEKEAAG